MQHLARQHVADPGDRARGAAIDEAVKHLRVDADHQRQRRVLARDVLGRVAQRGRAAELLEADEMRMAARGASKNRSAGSRSRNRGCCRSPHGRSTAGLEHRRRNARAARAATMPRDSTRGMIIRPCRAAPLGMRRESGRARRVLRARADDDRHAGRHQLLDAFHALLVGRAAASRPSSRNRPRPDMPARPAPCPCATRASKSGSRSGVQGVISAGMVPANISVMVIGSSFATPRNVCYGRERGSWPKPEPGLRKRWRRRDTWRRSAG